MQDPGNPADATVGEVLVLHAGGMDREDERPEVFGYAPFIRNCFVDSSPSGELGTGSDYRSWYRALSMTACRGGIVEANQVFNTWYGGPYFSHRGARDLVVRDNFFKNTVRGPYLGLQTLGSIIEITSLVRVGAATTAECTTSGAHGLISGDRAKIANASPSEFNGVFRVTAVTPPNTFRYEMVGRPSSDSAPGATMRKVWGVEKISVEGNVVELAPFTAGSTPIGVQAVAPAEAAIGPDYVYGDVTVRQNHIRYLDGLSDSGFLGYATDIEGARNLMVQDNVLQCVPPSPLKNRHSGAVSYFNNKTPGGVLVQGYNEDTSRKYDELETEADDAFVLAFMSKR